MISWCVTPKGRLNLTSTSDSGSFFRDKGEKVKSEESRNSKKGRKKSNRPKSSEREGGFKKGGRERER